MADFFSYHPENISITIRGVGANYLCTTGSVLKTNLASGFVLTLVDNIGGLKLEDIGFLGNATADGWLSYSGSFGFDWVLTNVKVREFTKANINCMDIEDLSSIVVNALYITGLPTGLACRLIPMPLTRVNMCLIPAVFGIDYDSKYSYSIGQTGSNINDIVFNACVSSTTKVQGLFIPKPHLLTAVPLSAANLGEQG